MSVALADGTPLGSAGGKLGITRSSLTVRNPAGEVMAELCGGRGERYELLDPRGGLAGVVARRFMSAGHLAPGVWRAYDISFNPRADVALRGLTLATLVAIDMRHLG